MRRNSLVGILLALVLSTCPTAAELSLAVSSRGDHSCCASSPSPKGNPQPFLPTRGDCCLRALANAPIPISAPALQLAFVVVTFDQPLLKVHPFQTPDAPDLSPPSDAVLADNRSPRAPPAVPA